MQITTVCRLALALALTLGTLTLGTGAGLAAQGFSMGSYGRSCSGTTDPQTCALLDARGLEIFVHGAAPGRAAVVIVGFGRADSPAGATCRLLVEPEFAIAATTGPDGRLAWRLPSPLDADPSWRGTEFCFQHAVEDRSGRAFGGGFVLTNGFSVRFF